MDLKLTGEEMLNLEFVPLENNNDYEIPWNEEKVGDFIIGEYILKKENVGKFSQNVYVLRDSDNQKRSVFGSTAIDTGMEKVEIGQYVKIVYDGINKSRNGNNYKEFTIMVANIEQNK